MRSTIQAGQSATIAGREAGRHETALASLDGEFAKIMTTADAIERHVMDEERPPICATCGVTMVPASLSGREDAVGDWICLECEETSEPDLA